jgi:hypothetical protein
LALNFERVSLGGRLGFVTFVWGDLGAGISRESQRMKYEHHEIQRITLKRWALEEGKRWNLLKPSLISFSPFFCLHFTCRPKRAWFLERIGCARFAQRTSLHHSWSHYSAWTIQCLSSGIKSNRNSIVSSNSSGRRKMWARAVFGLKQLRNTLS